MCLEIVEHVGKNFRFALENVVSLPSPPSLPPCPPTLPALLRSCSTTRTRGSGRRPQRSLLPGSQRVTACSRRRRPPRRGRRWRGAGRLRRRGTGGRCGSGGRGGGQGRRGAAACRTSGCGAAPARRLDDDKAGGIDPAAATAAAPPVYPPALSTGLHWRERSYRPPSSDFSGL
jgi:hypothetical protein